MYISIDIGGTKTRVASSKNLRDLHSIKKFPSSWDINEEKSNILKAISEVSAGKDVKAICIGVPGRVDYLNKTFFKLPNYAVLDNFPFDFLISGKYKKTRLIVENDAALAGLGEAVLGAGLKFKAIAYLTLSTGVGGVRVSKKKNSVDYFYAEPGHQIIQSGGRFNPSTGHKGSLEAYVSGRAFEDIFGVKPDKCEIESFWKEYADYLSIGVHNIISMWSPDLIVLGGSLTNKYSFFKKRLNDILKSEKFLEVPPIVLSEFRDDAGLIGGFVKIGISSK